MFLGCQVSYQGCNIYRLIGTFSISFENLHLLLELQKAERWHNHLGLTFSGEVILDNVLGFFCHCLFIHSGVLFFLELILVKYIFIESSVSPRLSKNSAQSCISYFSYLKTPIFTCVYRLFLFLVLDNHMCFLSLFLNKLARDVAVQCRSPFLFCANAQGATLSPTTSSFRSLLPFSPTS